MVKRVLVQSAMLAALASTAVAAATGGPVNLVTNGDFELPGFTAPPDYMYLFSGDSIPGWTVVDTPPWASQPALIARSSGYPTLEGTYTMVLTEGTAIQTTFAAVAGSSYRLSFLASVTNVGTGLNVTAAGHSTSFLMPTGLQTFLFTATATNPAAMLEFKNMSPDDGNFRLYWVDAVSVTPVPEPAAAYSLGAGLLTVFGFLHLRSKARRASRSRLG